MAGTDIALYNDPFEGEFITKAWTLAERISKSSFVPDVFRNKPEEVLAAFLSGREVGIGPMMSLQKINVIKGKPTQSAELMRALVQSHGHEIWTEDYNTTKVTVCGRRQGQEHVNKVTWTLDDAKRANLAGKDNWRQYPRAMLLARSTGELCRLMFADVLGGISYTVEELEDGIIGEPMAELPPSDEPDEAEPPKAITRKAALARKAAPKKAAAQAKAAPPQPPLPDEDDESDIPAESSSGDVTPESDDVVKERSQAIAIACQRAGLDDDGRHRLIEVVTNGRVASSKVVTAEEGSQVLQAAHDIASGHKTLIEGDDGWVLVEVEDGGEPETDPEAEAEAEPSEPSMEWGDEDRWGPDLWRSFLKQRGVTVTMTIKSAQKLAKEFDIKPIPSSLEQLRGQSELCRLVRGWVEEQSGVADA